MRRKRHPEGRASPRPMDEAARKKTLRMVPYGLYLLGARRAEVRSPEDLHATVVSWVTQTSFDPPMVVVGVGRTSHANALVKEARAFTLNVLGSDQKDLAKRFFKDHVRTETTMADLPYERGARTGCPVFPDLPAHLECEVEHVFDGANDHSVVVARVVDAVHRREAKPLTTGETGWTYAG